MNGFAWLNELMVWLGRWVPRVVLVEAGNIAVWFGSGGRTRSLVPGVYVYWPMFANVKVVSTRTRTFETAAMLLGREAIALIVSYRIVNPLTMFLANDDVFAYLDDRVQAFLARVHHVDKPSETLCADVFDLMKPEFDSIGVEILNVGIAQRGRVIRLKNLNDWAQHAKANL